MNIMRKSLFILIIAAGSLLGSATPLGAWTCKGVGESISSFITDAGHQKRRGHVKHAAFSAACMYGSLNALRTATSFAYGEGSNSMGRGLAALGALAALAVSGKLFYNVGCSIGNAYENPDAELESTNVEYWASGIAAVPYLVQDLPSFASNTWTKFLSPLLTYGLVKPIEGLGNLAGWIGKKI